MTDASFEIDRRLQRELTRRGSHVRARGRRFPHEGLRKVEARCARPHRLRWTDRGRWHLRNRHQICVGERFHEPLVEQVDDGTTKLADLGNLDFGRLGDRAHMHAVAQ
jgi:hypothetical protein